MLTKPLTHGLRRLTPLFAEIALGVALPESKLRRIAHTGNRAGMAHQHDPALACLLQALSPQQLLRTSGCRADSAQGK